MAPSETMADLCLSRVDFLRFLGSHAVPLWGQQGVLPSHSCIEWLSHDRLQLPV